MKITLVSLDILDSNNQICLHLKKEGHQVHHINFYDFKFKYRNKYERVCNFFTKKLFNTNIKNIYYGNRIIERLESFNEKQDIILTIKADFIAPKKLLEFKKYTNKSIAFFNDSISHCPKIAKTIHCFDEVYSFEKADCEKYNLNFLTNWMHLGESDTIQANCEYDVFNVSSKDKRYSTISKIAKSVKSKGLRSKIIVFSKKENTDTESAVEFTSKMISREEVVNFVRKSKVLLDVNRNYQKGLTFRVFEALGYHKKLITTNDDIVNYDFYNPNNIFIWKDDTTDIPKSFFDSHYEELQEDIFNKYHISGWVKSIFKLN